MKNRLAVFTVVLLGLIVCLQPVVAQDNTPANPAAVKTPLKSMVELGSVYTNIYDITITVPETLRECFADGLFTITLSRPPLNILSIPLTLGPTASSINHSASAAGSLLPFPTWG